MARHFDAVLISLPAPQAAIVVFWGGSKAFTLVNTPPPHTHAQYNEICPLNSYPKVGRVCVYSKLERALEKLAVLQAEVA